MDLDGGVESVDADQEERPPIPSATVCTVDELLHTTLVEDGVSVNVYGRCVTLSSRVTSACVLSSDIVRSCSVGHYSSTADAFKLHAPSAATPGSLVVRTHLLPQFVHAQGELVEVIGETEVCNLLCGVDPIARKCLIVRRDRSTPA